MAEEFPTRQRAILNANRGISNVIDYSIIKHDLQGVADKIFNILKGHYGPYSGFAAIDSGDPLAETQFTKDGIGIVRAIEFASPQEDWVRKTIAYIGTKMETAVGDGTTSSMMFACAALKHMLEHLHEIKPISYNQLRNIFNRFIEDAKAYLEDIAYKPDHKDQASLERSVRNIVYSQVYTSSHGDRCLAEALAKVFSKTPPELWGCMTYERRTYESDERFTVVESEGQYSFSCDVMAQGMLNKDLSTWYENKNCKVLVLNDTIRVDSPAWETIVDSMEKASAEAPLVIISHKRMDNNTYASIKMKLDDAVRHDRPVACFQIEPDNPKLNDFVTLQLLADKGIMDYSHGEVMILEGISVKYKAETLVLDNIYRVPEEYKDSLIRHHCLDGKHLEFTDYLEGVKKYADGYAKLDAPEARKKANMMYRMYAKLKYAKSAVLRIGGKALDNIALVDVVDDCMRASCKALQNGIVYGNNRSLYHYVSNTTKLLDQVDEMGLSYKSFYNKWIASRIKESLDDIAGVIPDRLYPDEKFTLRRRLKFIDWWYRHSVDLLDIDPRLESFEDHVAPDVYAIAPQSIFSEKGEPRVKIVQPANTDISMLERFAEVALKYVLTERIIVRGAAYVNNTRSKK